jgi:lactose/cellobiose-specific phosphotransferase system IIC component
MVESIGKLAIAFADNRFVRAIHNGLINLIPFVLVGAICSALLNLPVPVWQELLDTLFAGKWHTLSHIITFASSDIIGLAALLSVAYAYASEEASVKNGDIHPFLPIFAAFSCYVIIFVWDGDVGFTLADPGRASVFGSLVTALSSSWLFFAFVRLWAKIRPPRLSALDTNLQMRSAFRAVFPVVALLVACTLVRLFVGPVIPLSAMQASFSAFVNNWLIDDSLGSLLLTVILIQLLWFFGAHGAGMVLDEFPAVSQMPDSTQVMFATQDFYFNFLAIGGTGMMLGLLIAALVAGSRHRGKRLAKASLFPSLFNISEIFLYGIPLILNPFFLIPFLLAPLCAALLSFIAFSTGLVPPIIHSAGWTTPVFFSGYLSTGSIAAPVLQLVTLACSTVIYLPFVIAVRHFDSRRRGERMALLQKAAIEAADNEGTTVLARNDAVGETAREISSRLHGYFEEDTLPFYLVYQPKTDKDGRVMGAEALLRWVHPDFGTVSPVVLVELCDESGLATSLGRWITRKGIVEYARWKQEGICGLRLSINLNARHLCEDPDFPTFLKEVLAAQGVACGEIELEITEHLALRTTRANRQTLAEIRALGVELSIDDMGMGYSSLTYISDFDAKGVKIDAALVSAITTDTQQQEIVGSIIQLAEQLGLTAIVEGVEEKEQVDALVALGARYFQGYYFSKPLVPEDFIAFVRENGIAEK